jgi:hypothetical protein
MESQVVVPLSRCPRPTTHVQTAELLLDGWCRFSPILRPVTAGFRPHGSSSPQTTPVVQSVLPALLTSNPDDGGFRLTADWLPPIQ